MESTKGTPIVSALIMAYCPTYEAFANELGMTPNDLLDKLTGAQEWTVSEMMGAMDLLRIPPQHLDRIFYDATTPMFDDGPTIAPHPGGECTREISRAMPLDNMLPSIQPCPVCSAHGHLVTETLYAWGRLATSVRHYVECGACGHRSPIAASGTFISGETRTVHDARRLAVNAWNDGRDYWKEHQDAAARKVIGGRL